MAHTNDETHGTGEHKALSAGEQQAHGTPTPSGRTSAVEGSTPFGEWFSRTRAYFRIQQTELLTALGYKAQSAVSNIERGKRLPKTRAEAERIIEGLLNCQATRILTEKEKESLRAEGLAAWAQSHVGADFVEVRGGVRPGAGTIRRESVSDPDRAAYMAAFDKLGSDTERARLREIAEIYVASIPKD